MSTKIKEACNIAKKGFIKHFALQSKLQYLSVQMGQSTGIPLLSAQSLSGLPTPCEILGFYGSDYEGESLLAYSIVLSR
jgi:hypothetical protein